nr:hypothetical protein [archaeon]
NYKLNINAIEAFIEGIKEVPNRQKGYLEVTKETINELKTPSNWIKYSKEVVEETISFMTNPKKKSNQNNSTSTKFKKNNKQISLEVFESRGVLLLIILLAILLIIASIFRIKFF